MGDNKKNTFAVTTTLLLLLTVGGSIAGYKAATKPHHAEAAHEGEAAASQAAAEGAAATKAEAPAADPEAAQPTAEATDATDGVNNAGSNTDGNTNEPGTTGNRPEDMAAAQPDTNAASATGDAAAGAEKFAGTCAGCHGANAEGGVGPALNVVKDWSVEDFTTALREGRSPSKTLSAVMPRFVATQVSDQDITNILAHLKGL